MNTRNNLLTKDSHSTNQSMHSRLIVIKIKIIQVLQDMLCAVISKCNLINSHQNESDHNRRPNRTK